MSRPHDVVARQLERSGATLMLGLEPLDDGEFYKVNVNGFSAAWVTGHLACVADLFSSWFDSDRGLLHSPGFHAVFNETGDGTTAGTAGRCAEAEAWSKEVLLESYRRAVIRALRVLRRFDESQWDAPGPPGTPALLTGGGVWEHLAVHTYWHLGELAGSMPRFRGTYTLGILPHHFYVAPEA
jgi:hypothetical protein